MFPQLNSFASPTNTNQRKQSGVRAHVKSVPRRHQMDVVDEGKQNQLNSMDQTIQIKRDSRRYDRNIKNVNQSENVSLSFEMNPRVITESNENK